MSTPVIPDSKNFEKTIDGEQTGLYTIRHNDITCAITNYGARIVSLLVKDKGGNYRDIVLGFNSLDAYIYAADDYYGAIVGRYANRIAGGKFTLDGITHQLPINNGPNTLHSGKGGFHARVWQVKELKDGHITLHYFSPDGEEGFPGDLSVTITYKLDNEGLHIDYEAFADAATVINLSNHAYFNLNGEGNGTILNHLLKFNAPAYTPIDTTSIPFGEIAEVAGTPFDFRTAHTVGQRINEDNRQLANAGGYDHNFVLDKRSDNTPAVTISAKESGIQMDIYTGQPGMQFYSGNFLLGKDTGKSGRPYEYRTAFVLEPQHFPDSPNHENFPSTVLRANQAFKTKSLYKFSVVNA